MQLSEIIIRKIGEEGAISFRDFMEMCLYYPELGYYTSPGNRIGKEGDYYTSPDLGDLFGTLLGRQLEEMWRILGKRPFTIVEYGAGTGRMCFDILAYLKTNAELYEHLRYCIIERSGVMREKEQRLLTEKVSWYDSIAEIPDLRGCILSNELLDNFPVHQVVMDERLMEVFIDYREGEFVEVLRPAGHLLESYLGELHIDLPKGYRTEINLEALAWNREIAEALTEGFIITIDYGHPAPVLYSESRSCGTLVSYLRHQVSGDLYHHIGEQDITSHVNFSALCHWGYKHGLTCCGLTRQSNFLLALGFEGLPSAQPAEAGPVAELAAKQAFLKHTLLVDMGSKFRVLIQQKGPGKTDLLGLRYA